MTVLVEEHPGIVDLLPAVSHLSEIGTLVRIHVVTVGSVGEPSGLHDAVGAEVEVGAVDLHPSGLHLSVGAHVVPVVADLGPAEGAAAVGLEVIPAAVHVAPACGHLAGAAHEEVVVADLQPVLLDQDAVLKAVIPETIILDPAGGHKAGLPEIVPLGVDLLKAVGHGSVGKIHVVIAVRRLDPALVPGAVVVIIDPAPVFGDPAGGGVGSHHRCKRKHAGQNSGGGPAGKAISSHFEKSPPEVKAFQTFENVV